VAVKELPTITLGATTYYIDVQLMELRDITNSLYTLPLTDMLLEAINQMKGGKAHLQSKDIKEVHSKPVPSGKKGKNSNDTIN
jgi:hypothetical protein